MSAVLHDQNTTTKDWFQNQFRIYEQALNGHADEPQAQFRKTAFAEFEGLNFPTRRDEDWKYSGSVIGRFLETDFQPAQAGQVSEAQVEALQFAGLEVTRIVFVNGVLDAGLSQLDNLPAGTQVQTVEEALQDETSRSWMEQQVAQAGGTGANTFLPLNRAFAQGGLLIQSERKAQVDRPIHILHISVPGETAHLTHPQLFVRAQGGSDLTIIESFHTLGEGSYFTNVASWMDVESNARLSHYKIQLEGDEALQVNNAIVRQERDSTFSAYTADLGGKVVRNNLSTELLNSNTETNYYGIYLGTEGQHIDNQTFIDHAVPHCQSNELYKGILTDRARGVFNGKVLVRQDAQKTNAFQQNSSLVLSPNAVMDAKPQLEIFADDVRCSHGATIGQLDESSVFYLRTRGIPETQARQLLQLAFLGEVLDEMKIEAIADRVRSLIIEKLHIPQ